MSIPGETFHDPSKVKTFSPFSNGTEGYGWLDNNCLNCKNRAYNYEEEKSRRLPPAERACVVEPRIMVGEVSIEDVAWCGGTGKQLPRRCKHLNEHIITFHDPNQLELYDTETMRPMQVVGGD